MIIEMTDLEWADLQSKLGQVSFSDGSRMAISLQLCPNSANYKMVPIVTPPPQLNSAWGINNLSHWPFAQPTVAQSWPFAPQVTNSPVTTNSPSPIEPEPAPAPKQIDYSKITKSVIGK